MTHSKFGKEGLKGGSQETLKSPLELSVSTPAKQSRGWGALWWWSSLKPRYLRATFFMVTQESTKHEAETGSGSLRT
jgi:hypothetical protein